MGCDISLHVEVKINGKWEHYNHPYIGRNYELFCKMAGVRQYEDSPEPISQPRGLPEDASVMTSFDSRHDGIDGHSHSWLSSTEAGQVQKWFEEQSPKGTLFHPPLFGYLFGNDIDSYVRHPKDGERLKELGLEDARVVFWFDN